MIVPTNCFTLPFRVVVERVDFDENTGAPVSTTGKQFYSGAPTLADAEELAQYKNNEEFNRDGGPCCFYMAEETT